MGIKLTSNEPVAPNLAPNELSASAHVDTPPANAMGSGAHDCIVSHRLNFARGSELFKRTCLLIDRILADIRVQEEMWRLGRGVK